ncbi:hypothetical protein D9736_07930 [Escherichia sp. E10V10]|nr:hypothetical protein D9741_02440 [Escherichia sp. E14V7]RZN53354.1 hypothetical protein D9736_07930 [Escherichia sp. E10V10]TBR66757.1 hypothetical protein D9737_14880 [Escherichia sp. E10V4]TGB95403.1 hypothetical protein CRG94_08025 [Escherichia sp. E3356]TGC02078.1 hypothetical protein CRI63_15065 [Escherichia sp. E2661]
MVAMKIPLWVNAYILPVLRKTPVGSRGVVISAWEVCAKREYVRKKRDCKPLVTLCETLLRLTAGGICLQVDKVVIPEVLIGEVNFGLST